MLADILSALSAKYQITNEDDSAETGTGMNTFEMVMFPDASEMLQAAGIPSKKIQISVETPSPFEDIAVPLMEPEKYDPPATCSGNPCVT